MKITHTFHRISSTKWLQLVLVGFAFISSTFCYSQDYKTNDTIHVDEVVVSGESIDHFQAGVKIEKINPTQLEIVQDGNLENILTRFTPIVVKSQGSGLLTIRTRGTSPDHTSINFGGININSLTLGHANAGNIPLYLFDKVGIQYGSSSSVNGSGNIGGAIHLGLKNYWTRGIKAELRLTKGSFGEVLYGTKIHSGNGKFESVTRASYYYKENNFTFINDKNVKLSLKGKIDTQQNAQIEQLGLIQEFNYKFSAKETIKFSAWLENDWRLAQPNKSANSTDTCPLEPINNKHIRVWGEYNNRKGILKYNLGAGYVYDYQMYNHDPKTINTQRLIGQSHIEYQFIEDASVKFGTKAFRIIPEIDSYVDHLKFENRIDMFVSYQHSFFKRLKTTLNLRQGYVTGFKVPFTPAIGVSYITLSKETHLLTLNGNIAKSYKVPTFNDRFWDPGGNPDLKPESGINYELGAKWSFCSTKNSANIQLNTFYMDVDNWILWKPGGSDSTHQNNFWQAENVLNVISKGLEFKADIKYPLLNLNMHSGVNYALTSTKRVNTTDSIQGALYRQMEYVPLHSATLFTSALYKNLKLNIDGSYTHWQYTNEEDIFIYLIDEYILINISASYKYKLNNNNAIKLSGSINNILNTNYESTLGYATPGINYKISLTYNFK